MDNRPIGFLDSGVGGLTVVRELLRQLPHEDVLRRALQPTCGCKGHQALVGYNHRSNIAQLGPREIQATAGH